MILLLAFLRADYRFIDVAIVFALWSCRGNLDVENADAQGVARDGARDRGTGWRGRQAAAP